VEGKQKAKFEKAREEDGRLVKARYINHRGENERLDKPYCRWPGDDIQIWHMIPNCTYEVPYGLVKEVNSERAKLPKRSEILDQSGMPTKVEGASIHIHELVPVGF
jgi:hypothetical protein